MKEQLKGLIDWLDQTHTNSRARDALLALAAETLKREDSTAPSQRRFDAESIALAADPTRVWTFDSAKRWLSSAEMPLFLKAREEDLFGYFRQRGDVEYPILKKTESSGRHRAEWYFERAPIPTEEDETAPEEALAGAVEPPSTVVNRSEPELVYEFTAPGKIKLSLLGRLLLGRGGQVVTRSWGGVLWAGLLVTGFLLIVSALLFAWTMSLVRRPIQTSDLTMLLFFIAFAWVIWRVQVRPLTWLVDDRIIPASESLTKFSEEACQLNMAKDGDRRYIRLVRYSGVCPICAGKIELRYGQGNNGRRLFGCCSEVPQEHVFEFDRVTRLGRRYVR